MLTNHWCTLIKKKKLSISTFTITHFFNLDKKKGCHSKNRSGAC